MSLPVEIVIERTDAEIIARLIEIGKLPQPKTIWVVEDPRYGNTKLDGICYSTTTEHLDMFPYSRMRLEQQHITFYPSEHMEVAKQDALQRLTMVTP